MLTHACSGYTAPGTLHRDAAIADLVAVHGSLSALACPLPCPPFGRAAVIIFSNGIGVASGVERLHLGHHTCSLPRTTMSPCQVAGLRTHHLPTKTDVGKLVIFMFSAARAAAAGPHVQLDGTALTALNASHFFGHPKCPSACSVPTLMTPSAAGAVFIARLLTSVCAQDTELIRVVRRRTYSALWAQQKGAATRNALLQPEYCSKGVYDVWQEPPGTGDEEQLVAAALKRAWLDRAAAGAGQDAQYCKELRSKLHQLYTQLG